MKITFGCRLGVLSTVCIIALAAADQAWLSPVSADHRDALVKRLDGYVKATKSQDWSQLFNFISDVARGGVNRNDFTARMKTAHRQDFSNSPDLLEFQPARTIQANGSEYDVYGCATARREGQKYNGVALVHTVFQHDDWSFSGWTFTEFPNEPCKALSDPKWEAPDPMEWDKPMEELRGPAGIPVHIDSPKR